MMEHEMILVHTSQAEPSLEKTLRETGVEWSIINGAEALVENAHQHNPRLILIDLTQHSDDGLRAIRALRADALTAQLPIIVITAPEDKLLAEASKAGADDFLYAPLRPVEVQARLRSVLLNGDAAKSNRLFGFNVRNMLGMIDILAHDFRNPVGITFSSLQLVLEIMQEQSQTYPAEIVTLLRHALLAAQRQSFLIDDMLDTLRMEAGGFEATLAPLQIAPIVEAATAQAREIAQFNNINIVASVPPDLPQPVGDEGLLQRVINSALDTSVKFCMPGKTITLTAEAEADRVALKITDPGRPIQPPYDAHFFDPAVQTEARTKGSRSTVGMNMQFCQLAMLEMHGGISITSDGQAGLTTLTLWLPLAPQT
jgi:signal transduction histidine kinase